MKLQIALVIATAACAIAGHPYAAVFFGFLLVVSAL